MQYKEILLNGAWDRRCFLLAYFKISVGSCIARLYIFTHVCCRFEVFHSTFTSIFPFLILCLWTLFASHNDLSMKSVWSHGLFSFSSDLSHAWINFSYVIHFFFSSVKAVLNWMFSVISGIVLQLIGVQNNCCINIKAMVAVPIHGSIDLLSVVFIMCVIVLVCIAPTVFFILS